MLESCTGLCRAFLIGAGIQIAALSPQASAGEASSCSADSNDALRITVAARRDSIESRSVWWGATLACAERSGSLPVRLIQMHYAEKDAFEQITAQMQGQEDSPAHVIIGPTESAVFTDLVSFATIPDRPVPVVSPLVTARVGNAEDGWFFRMNVDSALRANRIYDHIESLGVHNISVLYGDGTFGEAAQMAFRQALAEDQRGSFSSYRYRNPRDDGTRDWVRNITEVTRPEAVGIFGSRADVEDIAGQIRDKARRSWFGYDPFLFTVVDTRPVVIPDMYFLSVAEQTRTSTTAANPDLVPMGEAVDLAYDTITLVLDLAESLRAEGIDPSSADFPWKFRDRLENKMKADEILDGSRTRMRFSALANVATPAVMQFSDGGVLLEEDSNDLRLLESAKDSLEIRYRRYGDAILVNLVLVAGIVLVLTVKDLTNTLTVRGKDLLSREFLTLITFNVFTAVAVFTILCETDLVDTSWDSTFSALVVAFGYTGLLNSTVFSTQAGEAVFARKYYESIVRSINQNIRRRQYERLDPVINHIAYANSQMYLQSVLVASYGFDRDGDTKQELVDALDAKLEGKSTIQQRRILAEELLNEMRDKTMQDRRIIPKGVPREKVQDPLPKVNEIVEGTLVDGSPTLDDARGMVDDFQVSGERADEFRAEYDSAGTPRAMYAVCFRWLIILCGYDYFLRWAASGFPTRTTADTAVLVECDPVDEERRHESRVVYEGKVLAECEDMARVGHLANLSTNGARILFAEAGPSVGDEIRISATASEGSVLLENAVARVVRESEEDDGTSVGVAWIDLSPRNVRELHDYVATLQSA